jgi:hypothetical protein
MDDERPGSSTACTGCRERDARIAESQRRLAELERRLTDSERRTTEPERKLAEVTRDSQRHTDVQRLAKHLRHHRHEWFLFRMPPTSRPRTTTPNVKSVRVLSCPSRM